MFVGGATKHSWMVETKGFLGDAGGERGKLTTTIRVDGFIDRGGGFDLVLRSIKSTKTQRPRDQQAMVNPNRAILAPVLTNC
jgi:hypothetical protein